MKLTHMDSRGRPRMVNVGHKPVSRRMARAEGFIRLQPATVRLIRGGGMAKGNVLATAELAGIQAAKQTAWLIPLCHPLPLAHVRVDACLEEAGVRVTATVHCIERTGVEMEALTAVAIALLTVYDMCKAADKTMSLEGIRLLRKTKCRM